MRYETTRLEAATCLLALVCCLPGWAFAQQSSANYKMQISLMNAGVDTVTSTIFKLASSLGDPFFTGPSASTNFNMQHGLWIPLGGGLTPAFVNAVSRKHHGTAGDFNLPLSPVPFGLTTSP